MSNDRALEDKIRDLLDDWRTTTNETKVPARRIYVAAADMLEALLPRTMADIEWSDAEHSGLCATYLNSHGNGDIVRMLTRHAAGIVCRSPKGFNLHAKEEFLTPLPGTRINLTPTSEPAEDTPEPEKPLPEDVKPGDLWIVEFDGQQCAAERELPGTEKPWWLMIGWRVSDEDVTLVSRLVPEVKA